VRPDTREGLNGSVDLRTPSRARMKSVMSKSKAH
jgi:hypothetical protein